MKKLNSEIYKIDEIYNFRDLVTHSANKYPDNVAYKFKRNLGKPNQEVIEKTYSQIKEEVEAFGTSLLKLELENKKIAVIGNNRYEWCVSYLTITTSNMVVVPLDKALPDAEIKSLIKRSKADAVVYENKYSKVFEEIKKDETTLKHFINMDLEKEENGILSFKELVEKGKEERKNGNKSYEEVKIDNEKMSILIFTSGTTNTAKGVMLSQKNITSNIMAMAKMSKMYPDDVLLSFLPLHQPDYSAVFRYIDFLCLTLFGKTRHSHDFSCQYDDEASSSTDPYIPYSESEKIRSTKFFGIIRE